MKSCRAQSLRHQVSYLRSYLRGRPKTRVLNGYGWGLSMGLAYSGVLFPLAVKAAPMPAALLAKRTKGDLEIIRHGAVKAGRRSLTYWHYCTEAEEAGVSFPHHSSSRRNYIFAFQFKPTQHITRYFGTKLFHSII